MKRKRKWADKERQSIDNLEGAKEEDYPFQDQGDESEDSDTSQFFDTHKESNLINECPPPLPFEISEPPMVPEMNFQPTINQTFKYPEVPRPLENRYESQDKMFDVLSQILTCVKAIHYDLSHTSPARVEVPQAIEKNVSKSKVRESTSRCGVVESVFDIPEAKEEGTPLQKFWSQDFGRMGNVQKERLREAKRLGGEDKRLVYYFYEKHSIKKKTKMDILRFYKELEASAFEFNASEIYQYYKHQDENEKAHNTYSRRGYNAMKRLFRI